MTKKEFKELEKIIAKANKEINCNASVELDEEKNINFEFQYTTSMGQDWSDSIYEICEDFTLADYLEELTEDMLQRVNNYDEDYEAYMWIGEDGHGKNGAPYHIKDIVDDMVEAIGIFEEYAKYLKKMIK